MTYIYVGVGLTILGGLIAAAEDGQAIGTVILVLASIVGGIGIIGQGVVVGMRYANHEEYLHRLFESADEDETA